MTHLDIYIVNISNHHESFIFTGVFEVLSIRKDEEKSLGALLGKEVQFDGINFLLYQTIMKALCLLVFLIDDILGRMKQKVTYTH
jgi:hypothetical protein